MRRIYPYLVLFLLGASSLGISAQLSRGGVPRESRPQKSGINWIQLKDVRSDQLILEDEWAAMAGRKSQRIAKEIPCELHPGNAGHWQALSDGTRIWQLGIQGEGALALGLVFNRFYLEPGVKLYVFDPEKKRVLGAYTDLNNKASYMLPVSYLQGDRLLVQLEVPAGTDDFGELSIGAVRHAYRPVFNDRSTLDLSSSGDCNVDINCELGADWQLVKRSVVRLINGEN